MRFPLSWGLAAQAVLRLNHDSDSGQLEALDSPFEKDFTPKIFIELARPGTGIANPAGDLVLVPSTQFSFEEKKNTKSVFIAALDSPQAVAQLELTGEVFWLDDRTIGHAFSEEEGVLQLYTLAINSTLAPNVHPPVLVGAFPTATASKFQYSGNSLVFSDLVYADGNLSATIQNDKAWGNRGTTAMVYNDANIRLWDSWTGPKSPSLFRVDLVRGPEGNWSLGTEFDNLLQGTGHASDDFHFVNDDVVYSSAPSFAKSLSRRATVYRVARSSPGQAIQLSDGFNYALSPLLNAQNTKAAWIEAANETGHFGIANIIVYDFENQVRSTVGENWDRLPQSIKFSLDGKTIYVTAEDHAKVKIFAIPIPATPATDVAIRHPIALTHSGAVSGVQPLPGGRLLFSKSSFTSPNDVYLIGGLDAFERDLRSMPIEINEQIRQVTHLTRDALKGKDLQGGEEFWFRSEDRDVHGWLFKPRGWTADENKLRRWPVAMVVHGGPAGSWTDMWSVRWNPAMFSEQGYFSIWMNPTGSTGFGAVFTDSIVNDWGGKPFVDMKAGFDHVLTKYPEIDPDRAVALGASWGGYAMNWLQGHPEYGFNFKALVCHDGVFDSAASALTSDAPVLFNHDFGGLPWSKAGADGHHKNNPARFVSKWSTPMLVIHGSKDYRLAEVEGIAAFHALQQLGVPSRLVVFPDENHWVLGHENSLEWLKQVFQWLNEWRG
ncbi:Alpha/Beta hydrolase protein [Mycena amicta]|nr:Alpha/Beta hydrolase protein [Mycena amicta]